MFKSKATFYSAPIRLKDSCYNNTFSVIKHIALGGATQEGGPQIIGKRWTNFKNIIYIQSNL